MSQLKVPYPLECWLAITENNVGPHAFRPDDVVTAVTGDTIEIVSDCLVLSCLALSED